MRVYEISFTAVDCIYSYTRPAPARAEIAPRSWSGRSDRRLVKSLVDIESLPGGVIEKSVRDGRGEGYGPEARARRR